MAELSDSVKDAFSFISERGVLGGIYLGSVVFGLFLASPQITAQSSLLPWLAVLCLLLSFIITSITYELLLPLFRLTTNPIARLALKRAVGHEVANSLFSDYGKIRRFRELFLASDGADHLKTRIKKDEKLRQTLTYFATASIAALTVIITADNWFQINATVKKIELVAVVYILIGTLIGQVFRSYSFGWVVAFAFIATDETKRSQLLK